MLDKGKSRLCLLYQHKERNIGTERSPTAPGGLSPLLSQGCTLTPQDLTAMWKPLCWIKPCKTGKLRKWANREDLVFIWIFCLFVFVLLLNTGTQIPAVFQTRNLSAFLDFSPQLLIQQRSEGQTQACLDCWDCNFIPKYLIRLPDF